MNLSKDSYRNGRKTPTLIFQNQKPVEISKNHFNIIWIWPNFLAWSPPWLYASSVKKNILFGRFPSEVNWHLLKVWIASILFTFLPVILLSFHQSLLFMEKFQLKEFIQNFLKCLAIHFGGDFFGPDSWHKKRLILFVFCSHCLMIWVFYNSSLTSELAQKKIQLPFEALWYKNENHWKMSCSSHFFTIFSTSLIRLCSWKIRENMWVTFMYLPMCWLDFDSKRIV